MRRGCWRIYWQGERPMGRAAKAAHRPPDEVEHNRGLRPTAPRDASGWCARSRRRCGFIGSAVRGLSHIDDERPHQQAIEFWDGLRTAGACGPARDLLACPDHAAGAGIGSFWPIVRARWTR